MSDRKASRGALPFLALLSVLSVRCAYGTEGQAYTPPANPLPDASKSSDPDPTLPNVETDASADSSEGPEAAAEHDAGRQETSTLPEGGPTGTALPAGPGDLIISEVMYDPSGPEPDSEWFEVFNPTASPRLLSGLDIADGAGRKQRVDGSLSIASGAYGVMARSLTGATAAGIPPSAVLFEYGKGQSSADGVRLANAASGGVSLLSGTTTIASAPYGNWGMAASASTIQLKILTQSGSQSASNWCIASHPWASGGSTGDKGTPGHPNDCP